MFYFLLIIDEWVLALHYESKNDFLLHLCIFDVVTGYKRTPFGKFLNSKKYKILRIYRNKHLNIESKKNKHFIKFIIHKEVLKLRNCEIAFLWQHFLSTRSIKTPSSMKALKFSRMMRTSKAKDFVFITIIKALLYSSTLLSKISITDHHDCATESCRPPFL